MEFEELPGPSPCLNPKQHSDLSVSVSATAQLTSVPDCSHRHTENLPMCSCQGLFPRHSWAVTQISYWCREHGMHQLCCHVQHQSKMTFFNARRKNEEVLSVEIVSFEVSNQRAKKHARFKQPLHIWCKINLRWMTLRSQVFAVGSSVLQILCFQIYSCNSHNYSIMDNKVFKKITGKMRECVQHSGVALTALSC